MAFDALSMQCVAQAVNRHFIYNSADDLSGANYFNAWAGHLLVGDHITQSNGTLVQLWTVTANDGTTVTVARHAVS